MPDVDLNNCTDEYITRFLLARKYRAEQAAALIAAYQAQIAHRQDIFGNLTARDPALQRALRAGIPGVLPARDRKEILIQDPRNQHSGFVAVVDWSGFSLRQGGALGAAALRNLIAALRGRFPARFKAIHFLSAPLYVQATLALVKPFLDEKTRNKIYLHGNNLSTLHEHLPTDILPAELGGTGPSFNPGLWAEPVIHSAMKEAELAALKKEKDERNDNASERLTNSPENDDKVIESRNVENYKRNEPLFEGRKQEKESFKSFGKSYRNNGDNKSVELSLIRTTSSFDSKNVNKLEEQKDRTRLIEISESKNGNEANKINSLDNRMDHLREVDDLALLELQSETNSNEFEMIPSRPGSEDSKDNSLDNRSEKILMRTGKSHTPTEEMNLIT
ncbi:clavesin-2-like isoform X2 [Polistes fuscatus]|uniref:clavesin-2-like isoform X2 n=1 Tax=Polistes fuscatus TaxID=30207 RepID=UPI001CA85832|nr:clavesin-2-like isoform X2 [Polistes fuscatus]